MVARRGWWLALAAGMVWGACATGSPFSCTDDAECTLVGEPGICVAGACAYPDSACPSGYAYPAGSSKAGECVSPEAAEDGTSTGDDGDDGDTTTGNDDNAEAPDDGPADSTGVDVDSGSDDLPETSGSESTTTAGDCPDPIGSVWKEAEPAMACFEVLGDTLAHKEDVDIWLLESTPAGGAPNCTSVLGYGVVAGNVEVCVAHKCEAASSPVSCKSSSPQDVDGYAACCTTSYDLVNINACNGASELFLLARADPDVDEICEPYAVQLIGD